MSPITHAIAVAWASKWRWKKVMIFTSVSVKSYSNLPHLITAGQDLGIFPGFLDCRQEQSDQDGDDGDDHEEFNQGKRSMVPYVSHVSIHPKN